MNTLTIATEGLLQADSGAACGSASIVAQSRSVSLRSMARPVTLAAAARNSALVSKQSSSNIVEETGVVSLEKESDVVVLYSQGPQGIQGPPGVSSGDAPTVSFTSDHPGTLTKGTPVCVVGGFLRKATHTAPFNEVIGLVFDNTIVQGAAGRVQTDGLMTLTQGQWEIATGLLGPLAVGETYWLQASGGMAPSLSAVVGEYIAPVGYALDATSFRIELNAQVRL